MDFCRVDECLGIQHKAGLCRAHYQRACRGKPLNKPMRVRLGTWAEMNDAIHAYYEATTDAEFQAAKKRIQRAARAWVCRNERVGA